MRTAIAQARSTRVLVPLTTMLVAGAVVAGSGAVFTSTTSSAPSVVTAGDFTQTNSKSNQAIFTAGPIEPGDVVTGTATVTNTGDFDGDFTLVETENSDTFTAGTLKLLVEDVTDPLAVTTVYNGNFGDLGGAAGSVALGNFAVNEAATYKFTVTLLDSATDAEQLKSASATFTWDAVQTPDGVV